MTAAGRESAVAKAIKAHRYMAATQGGATGCRGCTWTYPQQQTEQGRLAHEAHVATAVLAALDQPAPGADEAAEARGGVAALDELSRRMGSPRMTQGAPYSERLAWEGVVRFLRAALDRAHQPTPPAACPACEDAMPAHHMSPALQARHAGHGQPTPPAQAEAVAAVERTAIRALIATGRHTAETARAALAPADTDHTDPDTQEPPC